MTSYNFDTDFPPFFKGTNYFWWHEIIELCILHKYLVLWEIIVKCPVVIKKSKDEYTENGYKRISKSFKVLKISYCALTIDIYEFISHCDSAKEIWKNLYYLNGTNQNVC